VKHANYLQSVTDRHRWSGITPASGVGGEFPIPVPFRSRKAIEYARACRMKGQGTWLTRPTA